MRRFLVLSLLVACTTSPHCPKPPLDPRGTWSMNIVYAANGECSSGTLPESWTVITDPKGSGYTAASIVFGGTAVNATASGSSDCSDTDCSFSLTLSWTFDAINATLTQAGSWTLRADGAIDGYGTITSVDNGNPSNTCTESFTATGTRTR